MRATNNYIGFEKAIFLIRFEGFKFHQELAKTPTWFEVKNAKQTFKLNKKTATEVKKFLNP
jgi:hypothetical protein